MKLNELVISYGTYYLVQGGKNAVYRVSIFPFSACPIDSTHCRLDMVNKESLTRKKSNLLIEP